MERWQYKLLMEKRAKESKPKTYTKEEETVLTKSFTKNQKETVQNMINGKEIYPDNILEMKMTKKQFDRFASLLRQESGVCNNWAIIGPDYKDHLRGIYYEMRKLLDEIVESNTK